MASLLVVIELVGERAHPVSLEALGLARRVGTALGATVYAAVPCEQATGSGEEDLIAVLSRHGADKVLLVPSAAHAGPLRWGGHGPALVAVCQLVRPTLVLIGGTHGGRDLTGRLAARLGAACLVDAHVDFADDVLSLREGAGETTRRIEGEPDFLVVAQIAPGAVETAAGEEEAEVEMLEPPPPERDFEALAESEPAACALVLGEGAGAEALARALQGSVDRATAAPLVIGLDEAAGALAIVAGATRVAIGAAAGSRAAANYAVEGEAATIVRELAEALAERTAATGAT